MNLKFGHSRFTIILCFCLTAFASMRASADTCAPSPVNPVGFDSQVILDSMDVIEKMKAPIDSGNSCYTTLNDRDRKFLKELFVQLAMACQGQETNCPQLQNQAAEKAFARYEAEAGPVAVERVLTAIRAQVKQKQLEEAYQIFRNPVVAPAFKEFAKAMVDYELALRDVAYRDPDSTWKVAKARLSQWFQISTGLYQGSLKKADRAGENFLWKTISLNQAIKNINLPAEQEKSLLEKIQVIRSHMMDRNDETNARLHENSAEVLVGAGAIASLALAWVGAEGISLTYASTATGQAALATLQGSVAGGVLGAGAKGAAETTEIVGSARNISQAHLTRVSCELARKVKNQGREAVDEVLEAGRTGMMWGAGMGGGFSVAGIAATALPESGRLIVPVLGAIAALYGGGQTLVHEKQNLAEIAQANQELEKMRLAVQEGRATPGMLEKATLQHRLRLSHALGNSIENGVNLGALAVGVTKAVRAPQSEGPDQIEPRVKKFKYVHSPDEFRFRHFLSHIARLGALSENIHTIFRTSFPNVQRGNLQGFMRLHDIGKITDDPVLMKKYGVEKFLSEVNPSAHNMGEALWPYYGRDRFADQNNPVEQKLTQNLKKVIDMENTIDKSESMNFLKQKKLVKPDGTLTPEAQEIKAVELIADWLDRRLDPVAGEELGKGNKRVPPSKIFDDPGQREWFLKEMELPLRILGEAKLRRIFEVMEARYSHTTQGLSFEEFNQPPQSHDIPAVAAPH